MTEGWHNENYYILFDGAEESSRMTEMYDLKQFLPDFTIVGLLGWDDFILRDKNSRHFSIPTVPLDFKYAKPYQFADVRASLQPDARFSKKIKWHVNPIVFGGNAIAKENTIWIPIERHAELVRWWNIQYRSINPKS